MTKPISKEFTDIGSKGFLNLPDHHDYTTSKVVVVPFGLEKSVTFECGTDKGPDAIIAASHEVELYDMLFKSEPYKKYGVATLKKFPLARSHQAALNQLRDLTAALLEDKKFPVILGGEHSLSGGSIPGVRKAFPKGVNVLHFDAHSDLRPEFEGNTLSHGSAMYLALPYLHRIVQLGIRNASDRGTAGHQEGRRTKKAQAVHSRRHHAPQDVELPQGHDRVLEEQTGLPHIRHRCVRYEPHRFEHGHP